MKYVEVLYHLAITFWVGGNALFTFVLTPLLFKTAYFRWGLACGTLALVCRLVAKSGRLELAAIILAVMLATTSFQAFYVAPKAAALKVGIGSFETTPKDHPLRKQFSRLHGVSAVCNLVVLAGGVVLVVLF